MWITASDRHTCSTSLAARRQKRAEILGSEAVSGSSKKPALMVTAMLLLQPLPVPAAPLQPLCPYFPPPTSFNLLGFFKLLHPDYSCPYPSITSPQTSLLLPSLSPDIPYLCPSPRPLWPYFFSKQLFPVFPPFPALVPCLSRWGKESRTPAQTSCLPPSTAPLPGFPLLPHCSTQGRAELSQGEF